MKLALVVFLAILACCCSFVSSYMCDPVDEYVLALLTKSNAEFKEISKKYANDEDGVDASMEFKKTADELTSEQNEAYYELSKKVMAKCKKSWKEEQ